jgi:hypothetical protein
LTIKAKYDKNSAKHGSSQMQAAFIGYAIGTEDSPTAIRNLTLENIQVNFRSSTYSNVLVSSFIGVAGSLRQSHVTIENCNVTGFINGYNGYKFAGFVAENYGKIIDCDFNGIIKNSSRIIKSDINQQVSPGIGGFVALNLGDINRCSVKCEIIVNSMVNSYLYNIPTRVSGIAFENGGYWITKYSDATIRNCSASGRIIAESGIVEFADWDAGIMENCQDNMVIEGSGVSRIDTL